MNAGVNVVMNGGAHPLSAELGDTIEPGNEKAWALTNIGELTTNDAEHGGSLKNAAIVVQGSEIVWVGAAAAVPACDERHDAGGAAVLPGWVDAHTHLIFAGDRGAEFSARLAGEAYAAGGINVTVEATRAASDRQLRANLHRLAAEAQRGGTTTLETKTGYGLTTPDEQRAARIAAEVADTVTFLGAHVVPQGRDRVEYLTEVTGPMLAAVRPHVAAVDVFCETGAFDRAESAGVLRAARAAGLHTHVHGNQLGHGPGAQLAVEHGSLSVDHLGFVTAADVDALADSWRQGAHGRGTVATLLPACDLSTRMPLAPARQLTDAGVRIALATNCNPGTSYTTSMGYVVATAVLQMRLTVAEAVAAATIGGATALAMHEGTWPDPRGVAQAPVGVIRPGYRADLQQLYAPSAAHLAYRPGVPLTAAVWKAGQSVGI